MKENKYDEEAFFNKYTQMNRSIHGLEGAGEWSELEKMLPDFQGKRVLDLGCGYGWHCVYAAQHGAKAITGVDISNKMLAVAQKKCEGYPVKLVHSPMEDLVFSKESYDVILSSLAFHYVRDFHELVSSISNWLTPEGSFVFSVEHPIFTSYGSQDWYYGENGEILHFPVDNYFYEGKREAVFLGEKVIKYHRTLTTYLNELLENGFVINKVIEPQPPENMMYLEGMKDEMRRPMMLLISATKKG